MLYFAYCTLLDAEEMARYCPTARATEVGWVADRRVTFETHRPGATTGGCNLRPAADQRLYGVLYEVSDAELAGLDAISGVPAGNYRHLPLAVTTAAGGREAVTYEIPHPGGPFAPSPAYTRPILAGARALALPTEYVAELERVIAEAQLMRQAGTPPRGRWSCGPG